MRATWHALQADLVQSTNRRIFQADFADFRQRYGELRPFGDAADLLDRLHAPGEDYFARNAILVDLVSAAQAREGASETAVTLVLLAVWPGLDAVHHRLSRHFRGDPEELVSQISTRVVRGIHVLDLERVVWIAATLIRNTERDIRRDLAATRAEAKRRDALAADLQSDNERSILRLSNGLDADSATRLIGEQLREWIGEDTGLVVAIAILGHWQHEAAEQLGLSHEATRKRYQRALRRLRVIVQEIP